MYRKTQTQGPVKNVLGLGNPEKGGKDSPVTFPWIIHWEDVEGSKKTTKKKFWAQGLLSYKSLGGLAEWLGKR